MNRAWIDVETTGFSKTKNDIVELAVPLEIDGGITVYYHEYMQPINWSAVEQSALDVHGLTIEKLKTFQTPRMAFKKFLDFMEEHKEHAPFELAGHNANFDRGFLYEWFKKCGSLDEYHNYFKPSLHCTLEIAKKKLKKPSQVENHKLGTLCKYFDISLENAHNALEDIGATIKLDKALQNINNSAGVQAGFFGQSDEDADKVKKYFNSSHVLINGDGSIYIHEWTTKNPEALVVILDELKRRFA